MEGGTVESPLRCGFSWAVEVVSISSACGDVTAALTPVAFFCLKPVAGCVRACVCACVRASVVVVVVVDVVVAAESLCAVRAVRL